MNESLATAFPLTFISLVLANVFGIWPGGDVWVNEAFSFPMVGGRLTVHWGDLMVLLGLVFLFFEMLKAARPAPRTIANHLASTVVLIIYIIEFVIAPIATNATFLLLTAIALFDVACGFTISIRTAGRDVTYSRDPGAVV